MQTRGCQERPITLLMSFSLDLLKHFYLKQIKWLGLTFLELLEFRYFPIAEREYKHPGNRGSHFYNQIATVDSIWCWLRKTRNQQITIWNIKFSVPQVTCLWKHVFIQPSVSFHGFSPVHWILAHSYCENNSSIGLVYPFLGWYIYILYFTISQYSFHFFSCEKCLLF